MAIRVREIMNPELCSVRPSESVGAAEISMRALGITTCPVLDTGGSPIGMVSLRELTAHTGSATVSAVMTSPPLSVRAGASIEEAGRLLAESGYHHLPVIDESSRAVGVVSALDVVRGLLGLPASHPAVFPHLGLAGLVWTDDTILESDRIEVAPEAPGVLVLIRGGAQRPETIVWVEAPNNVRSRLLDILSLPQTDQPGLTRLLEEGDLRFRAAAATEPMRTQVANLLRARLATPHAA